MSYQNGVSKGLNASAFSAEARRAALIIHVITIAISIAYSVNHLFFGVFPIGVSTSASAVFMTLATLAIIRKNPNRFYYYIFFFCQFFSLIGTSYVFGLRGIILIYPMTAAMFYVLSYRTAYGLAFLFFVASMIAASGHFELQMLLRLGVALLMSILISGGFAYMVEKQRARLAYDANHDHLTRILNRRGFIEMLNKQVKDARKYDEEVCLFFIDLNKFKTINDTYGHATGDELLRAFANRISGTLRNPPSDEQRSLPYYFGRFSGDEFVIAFRLSSNQQAKPIAQRLLDVCSNPFSIDNVAIQLDISVGICYASKTDFNAQEMIKKADEGMYIAKATKHNSIYVCDN